MLCVVCTFKFFFFNDTATTEIYTYGHTLSLHDALPIWVLVLRPDRHTAFLRDVYETGTENRYSAMEQMWLSYRMFQEGPFTPLDPRFKDRKSTRLNSSH